LALSALGSAWPAPGAGFADSLGAAAGPCALIACGMFLVGKPVGGQALTTTLRLTALKLFLNPLITWICIVTIAPMPPLYVQCAVILAALPTGALVFTVAERYGVFAEGTSSAILMSTTLSALTLSILFAFKDQLL